MKNIIYEPADHSRQWISKYSIKKIALPPRPIQDEIARILDKFTELIAELTAELTARREQFDHYIEEILFNNNYNLIAMEEICTLNQGLQIPISKRKLESGDNRYFYITVQFLKGIDKKYYIENPPQNAICNTKDILVTRTGSTGTIITGVSGCFHNNFFKVNYNNEVRSKYLFYVLSSKRMYNKMLYAASDGVVPDLPHKKFYKLKIPIPFFGDTEKSLAEQDYISVMLDQFSILCNDIRTGLPAEIKAREEQYEYYRDKLLTFKEVSYE